MIRQLVALTRKEFQLLGQDRPALALLFLMPAFFIVVMSFALANVFEAGTEERPIAIAVAVEDGGALGRRVVDELRAAPGIDVVVAGEDGPLDRARAESLVRDRIVAVGLVLPSGLSEPGEAPARATLIADPATPLQVVGPLRGAVEGVLRSLVLLDRVPDELRGALQTWADERGERAPPETLLDSLEGALDERLAGIDPTSVVDVGIESPAGVVVPTRPSATQQSVPAYTIFGVFFITLTLATSVVRERDDGILPRLLTTPVPRPVLLVGKLIPYFLVNLVQIALMFLVGKLLFDHALGNAVALGIVSLALAGTATGLGLLIAAFGRTEAQVGALAVSSTITLSALGGLMVPSYVMPGPMQAMARATPHAWALDAYHDVMLRGGGTAEVLAEVGVLAGFSAVFFSLAALRFRFR